MPVCLGHHPRDLAVNIPSASELSQIFIPWGKYTITNAWFSNMINNEDLIWVPINELNCLGQMFLENQNVVSEIELLQRCYATIEVVSEHELIVRFVVNRMAYRFDFW